MTACSARYVALAALLVAGCAEPESIRVLDEPAAKPPAKDVPTEQKQFRTLAAMIPADAGEGASGWWVLKLSGPAAVVAKYEADFDKVLQSARSSADEKNPISWESPAGWTNDVVPKDNPAIAILKAPGGDAKLTVTPSGGSVVANTQRWWGHLWGKDKEDEITPALLPNFVAQREVKGRLVLRVDVSGPNDPNKKQMMNMPNPHNPHGGQ